MFFFCYEQVLECAVVGVPDEVLGEKVLAILVLRHGDKGAAAGEKPLIFFFFTCWKKILCLIMICAGKLLLLRLLVGLHLKTFLFIAITSQPPVTWWPSKRTPSK